MIAKQKINIWKKVCYVHTEVSKSSLTHEMIKINIIPSDYFLLKFLKYKIFTSVISSYKFKQIKIFCIACTLITAILNKSIVKQQLLHIFFQFMNLLMCCYYYSICKSIFNTKLIIAYIISNFK